MTGILSAIGILIIAIATLLVLTQTVSIAISKKDYVLLRFNFTFFAFSLTFGKDDAGTHSKKKRKRNGYNISYFSVIRLITYFLSGSHLTIRAFNFPKADPDHDIAPIIGIISITRSTLLAYLVSTAASFEFSKSESDSYFDIDVVVYTPFIHLIFTALLYLKELYRIKRKRRARQLKIKINSRKTE